MIGCRTAQQNDNETRKACKMDNIVPSRSSNQVSRAAEDVKTAGIAVRAIEADLHIQTSARVGIVNDQVMK